MNSSVSSKKILLRFCLGSALAFAFAPFARTQQSTATTVAEAPVPTEADTAPTSPPATAEKKSAEQRPAPEISSAAPVEKAAPAARPKQERAHSRESRHSSERVSIGHDAYLAQGEQAESVVAVLGSVLSEGEVSHDVVSVLGNTRITGPAGGSVVAVLGNVSVNSKVGGEVVAVLGNVELGPKAEVNGKVLAVGGTVTRHPDAMTHEPIEDVPFSSRFTGIAGLQTWLHQCFFYGRLLAFGPNLAWAWWIALGCLGLYLALAALFRPGMEKCLETLRQRPGRSVLAVLLTALLTPIVIILLMLTVVGIVVVPFVATGLFAASLFGHAVMLAWLGRCLAKPLPLVLAVLLGGVIVLALYTIPILGLIVWKGTGLLGTGVVIYTLLLGMRREQTAGVASADRVPSNAPTADVERAELSARAEPAAEFQASMVKPVDEIPPAMPTAALPRAGFWIRVAALLIDLILLGAALGALTHKSNLLLSGLAVYGAVMWKWRGTTVGGIICGLKVVRLDDRPLDWSTAIVRALGCFVSLIVAGLGFIWVAFDDERQSWHDKIAGTVVVKVPKSVSLV